MADDRVHGAQGLQDAAPFPGKHERESAEANSLPTSPDSKIYATLARYRNANIFNTLRIDRESWDRSQR
jgi:hypothetical protein